MTSFRQDYSYAIDEFSNLIKVNVAEKRLKYFCPYCKEPMIPRQGKKRKWHFAHKPDTLGSCNYESYLHKIAKIRIKQCFDESENFYIRFSPECTCNVPECPINMQSPCSWNEPKNFEIKQFYDTCSIECCIDGFIADLALTNSCHQNRDPILIEICVTHKSTEEKIKSGLRIIEIKILSEDDIETIVESNLIQERTYYRNEWDDGVDLVKFYNFKGHSFARPSKYYQQTKYHFWIDHKRYFHLDGFEDYNYCLTPLSSELLDAIFRIDSSCPVDLDFAFNELLKTGLDIKYCNMCAFYRYNEFIGRSLCVLYKSKGTKKHPVLSCANTCPFFSLKRFDITQTYLDDCSYRVYVRKG